MFGRSEAKIVAAGEAVSSASADLKATLIDIYIDIRYSLFEKLNAEDTQNACVLIKQLSIFRTANEFFQVR